MAKLSGYKKLVKWIRVGDDFKKVSTETRAESVIMDNKGTTLAEEVKSLKKSVSDGKEEVAAAITDKGVETAADASFEEMAENIENIRVGSGNATQADVLEGKTFTNDDGVEYTGEMPGRTNASIAESAVVYNNYFWFRVPYGYYPPGDLTDENGNKTISEIKYPLDEVKNKVGFTDYKQAVVDGLAYSGIDITSSTSATDLKNALLTRFPQQLVLYNSGTFGGGITRLTNGRNFDSNETQGSLVIYSDTLQGGSAHGSGSFLEEKSDNILWTTDAGHNASLVSTTKVDVSSFKTIKITASSSGDSYWVRGVLYTMNGNGTDNNAIAFNLNEEFSLKNNNIAGEYYIGLYVCANSHCIINITNITLTA